MENLLLTGIFLFTLFFLLGTGVWIGLALMGVAFCWLRIVYKQAPQVMQ
jgi:hypothetical protein